MSRSIQANHCIYSLLCGRLDFIVNLVEQCLVVSKVETRSTNGLFKIERVCLCKLQHHSDIPLSTRMFCPVIDCEFASTLTCSATSYSDG